MPFASKRSHGFTLVELMIVVAIIGILAAIAMPAYRDYIARAQASEAFSLLAGKKIPLAEFYADAGRWPSSVASVVDVGTAGNFVATVSITQNGNSALPITLTALIRPDKVSADLRNKSINLTSSNGASWTCSSPDVEAIYLPRACR